MTSLQRGKSSRSVQRSDAAHPEYLEGLRQLCDQFGVTLVFDEIVTGFRHALGGAAEVFGVTPDLGAFGKALGGGLPVAAVAGRADIMDHANPHRSGVNDGYTYVTSSQAGNPLAAAAGVATLDDLAGKIPHTVDEAEVDCFITHWFSPEAEKHKAVIRAKITD